MASTNKRTEALRDVERQTLSLIAEVSTSEEWAELLAAPLKRSVARGNRSLARKLVQAGAEIGDALHVAVESGHRGIANDLLVNGASVEAVDDRGRTPLHRAASHGKPEMVQLLLLKGADTSAWDTIRLTPLFLAVARNNEAAVLALLAGGADVTFSPGMLQETTALHIAAQMGHVEIMRTLIEHGAKVDTAGSYGFTALHVAALQDRSGVIDVLMEAGADIEARMASHGTPLHNAAAEIKSVAVTALLKHGAEENVQDEDGDTPLHEAACRAGTRGAAEVVDLLLRSGADEMIMDQHGRIAEDVVGTKVEEEDRIGEDVNLVHKLLANAPADRAWRRRGYLVLCRAHPDRVQLGQDSTGKHGDVARRTRSRNRLSKAEARGSKDVVGGSRVRENTGGDWAGVVRKVLDVREEGIFRTIVGFL